MSFRQDRVRVVAVWSLPAHMSKEQLGTEVHNFLQVPMVKKNLLKFDISLANDALHPTLQALGFERPSLNCVVIVEAETHEKIQEITRDPAFQQIFQGSLEQGHVKTSEGAYFSADFMTGLDN
ncbi:EthD domain-containing protein [Favolaschia claudopus]|uniref:EthD domain-containing protein n=1 Tax=Favolaschia claudopus TaxID=2862362 RepID=A0AAW0EHW8_9AGAR